VVEKLRQLIGKGGALLGKTGHYNTTRGGGGQVTRTGGMGHRTGGGKEGEEKDISHCGETPVVQGEVGEEGSGLASFDQTTAGQVDAIEGGSVLIPGSSKTWRGPENHEQGKRKSMRKKTGGSGGLEIMVHSKVTNYGQCVMAWGVSVTAGGKEEHNGGKYERGN